MPKRTCFVAGLGSSVGVVGLDPPLAVPRDPMLLLLGELEEGLPPSPPLPTGSLSVLMRSRFTG